MDYNGQESTSYHQSEAEFGEEDWLCKEIINKEVYGIDD